MRDSLLNRYVLLLEEIFWNDSKAVAVFGPFARGLTKFPGSDIDLLITDVVLLYDEGILSEELDKIRKRLRDLGARRSYTKIRGSRH